MIVVRELSKSFVTDRGRIDVLKNVDLDIEAGERIAVVGASGAGKTTLMHLLGGLDRPSSGSVLFAEKDIFNYSSHELDAFRNRSIGFVFQFHQLLPEFNALENVMMPALIGRTPVKDAELRAIEILKAVGLEHRTHAQHRRAAADLPRGGPEPGPLPGAQTRPTFGRRAAACCYCPRPGHVAKIASGG